MRVLVVGSLPPPATARSRALLAEVLAQRREGASVRVLSPTETSVAHAHLELKGPAAAVELVPAARWADRVVVQLEPGFPLADDGGRGGRAVGLGALVAALHLAGKEVTLRLHSAHDLPGGAGGRSASALWHLARRIEVGDEATRELLAAQLPTDVVPRLALSLPAGGLLRADAGRAVGGGAPVAAGTGGAGGPAPPADAGAAELTALVRARAAAERGRLLGVPDDFFGRPRLAARVARWEWAPAPGAGVPRWAEPAAVPASGPAGRPRPGRASSVGLREAVPAGAAAAGRRLATWPVVGAVRMALRAASRRWPPTAPRPPRGAPPSAGGAQ